MARGKGALLLLLLTSQGLRRARGSAEHERAKDSVVITLPRFFRGVRLLIPRVYVYACLGRTTTTIRRRRRRGRRRRRENRTIHTKCKGEEERGEGEEREKSTKNTEEGMKELEGVEERGKRERQENQETPRRRRRRSV